MNDLSTRNILESCRINFSSFERLPGYIYCKNTRGEYIAANRATVKISTYKNLDNFLGLTDAQTPWADYTAEYRHNDLTVMESAKPLIITENITLCAKPQALLAMKFPLQDANAAIHGILGINLHLGQQSQQGFQGLINELIKAIEIPAKPHVNLSPREKQCLRLSCQGKYAWQIASELDLSKRTVESYLENIKSKLGVRNKMELIQYAIENRLD